MFRANSTVSPPTPCLEQRERCPDVLKALPGGAIYAVQLADPFPRLTRPWVKGLEDRPGQLDERRGDPAEVSARPRS
jgi:hypothetical protein